MEISTDPDGRVYVRWHDGGPFTVLDPDGSVSVDRGVGGSTEWAEYRYEPRPHIPDGFAVPASDGATT
jgi:hypothetical protein